MKHFKTYSRKDVQAVTHIRRFETRLGERVQVPTEGKDLATVLQETSARVVLFGIAETIGNNANYILGQVEDTWLSFLGKLLNQQSNDFLDGQEVLVLGHFDFSDMQAVIENNAHGYEEKIEACRHAVVGIDAEVEQLVHLIAQNRKLPVVISNGQNNAYPCMKGAAKGWYKAGVLPLAQINAVNLDACAGYGPLEGRHSGNAFRYAEEDGYLEKYCIIGLQEESIPQNVWLDIVNNPFADCITYQDIYVHEKHTMLQAIAHAADFTEDTLCGIEVSLNAIAQGVPVAHARQLIHYLTADSRPAYLHVSGACYNGTAPIDNGAVAAGLVSDFVKSVQQFCLKSNTFAST